MPTYLYSCPRGHETESFTALGGRRPSAIPCHCGASADYDFGATARTQTLQPIIHEHFNESLGIPILGRTQLRAEQKERGVEDYDPKIDYDRIKSQKLRDIQTEGQRKIDEFVSDIAPTLPRTNKRKRYKADDGSTARKIAVETARLERELASA